MHFRCDKPTASFSVWSIAHRQGATAGHMHSKEHPGTINIQTKVALVNGSYTTQPGPHTVRKYFLLHRSMLSIRTHYQLYQYFHRNVKTQLKKKNVHCLVLCFVSLGRGGNQRFRASSSTLPQKEQQVWHCLATETLLGSSCPCDWKWTKTNPIL